MKNFIKDYLSFNKQERNGIYVLLLILVAIIIIPYIVPFFITKETVDFSAFRKDIDKFSQSLKKSNDEQPDKYKNNEFDYSDVDNSSAEIILHPFNFNPNNLPEEKWKELGFTDKQIKIIKNYEAKGGKFYKKEDVKKIYGISESEYNVLEPFIQITKENKTFDKKESASFTSDKNTVVIELNAADTTDLKKLKGIGSWYAKKIIAYRDKLGGFYKKEQLLEVKGIDSSRYEGFADFVSINILLLKTININTATLEQLKAHPYIGYNISLSLINFRKIHGKFTDVAGIKQLVLITNDNYNKMFPYLIAD